jgi:hypothetical protein
MTPGELSALSIGAQRRFEMMYGKPKAKGELDREEAWELLRKKVIARRRREARKKLNN